MRSRVRGQRSKVKTALAATISVLLMSIGLLAQQRDTTVTAVGTGEISGVVMSAGAQPQPVRRVIVSLSGDIPLRSVVTDDAGRFSFGRLPAGAFYVTAKKSAYLDTEYGSPRPGLAGSRVALAAGERRSITLTMFRGAVIAGTLRDPSGLPLSGVTVSAVSTRLVAQGVGFTPESATTDDRGNYRIYGLLPGEYVVSAGPSAAGSGEIGTRTIQEMDALLAALGQRNRAVPAQATAPLPPSAPVAFSPIYYPGTPLYAEAARLRLAAGDEREGTSYEAGHHPAAAIEGVVNGETPNLASVQLSITPDGPRIGMGTFGITSVPPNAKGEFRYGNLPPGRYRIVARARRGAVDGASVPPPGATVSSKAGLGGGPPPPGVNLATGAEMIYAVADVDVPGQDVKGVGLNLQPGGSIAGKVVFDALKTGLPDDLTTLRVGAYLSGGSYVSQSGGTRVGNALAAVPPVNLKEDGTFLIVGLGPAQYFINTQLPANLTSVWKMRSAVVGGRDLLDTLIEGPAVNLTGITLTLTDKRTELSGTLQSASGQPVADYFVVAFSADRSHWRQGARRSVSARPATNGRFVFDDLPPGNYLVAALTDLDAGEWQRAEFLDQVAPAAIKVTIAEGDKKVQDLRIK
jgi:hypothetical protein